MKNIIVTGDVTADWNIARLCKSVEEGKQWNREDLTRACLQPGGAAMLGELLQKIVKNLNNGVSISALTLPEGLNQPADNRAYHSYAMWKQFPVKKDNKNSVWRVENFLGLDNMCGSESKDNCEIPDTDHLPKEADLVVIDDAGLLFRDRENLWPKAITEGTPQWIIVKIAHPIAKDIPGTLWNYLLEKHADRTIIITSINDLRKCAVGISQALSWEKTALDLNWELKNNSSIASLKKCAHVIISLGTAGAFLYSRMKDDPSNGTSSLLYDPKCFEGTWGKQYEGMMVGYNVCMTAAIVREMMQSPDIMKPLLMVGIRRGVQMMRKLQIVGYGPTLKQDKDKNTLFSPPSFPSEMLAAHDMEPDDYLCWHSVPNTTHISHNDDNTATLKQSMWSILDDICNSREQELSFEGSSDVPYFATPHQILLDLASDTVRFGHKEVLKDVPIAYYGKLITADRREIEAFSRIAAMIKHYCSNPDDKPRCIAVFGSPGSGKSFGVKQVAKTVAPNKIEDITFNISQFTQNKDLTDALHQVRDICLSGKIPLVFWDEFDTDECRWLRSFLAPMQDGVFQDGQITYHIGNAIFVFAGGTSDTMADFGDKLDKGKPDGKFTQVKGPDFVSRLHNFLNVLGPNQVKTEEEPNDSHFLIRRAMLLRSMFERDASQLFTGNELHIEDGVLRALLNVEKYLHGARSMEAVIRCSSLANKNCFERSALPPVAQLDIHVNGRAFMGEIQQLELGNNGINKTKIDLLAAGVHKVYCDNDGEWHTETAKIAFAKLDEGFKEENRRNVQDMFAKLKHIGYTIAPKGPGQVFTKMPPETIEPLAEMEHMRWMKSKINMGWVYDPVRVNDLKKHDCLLPWKVLSDEELALLDPRVIAAMGRTELPELEKNKDRVLVEAIPKILDMAGYVLVKM